MNISKSLALEKNCFRFEGIEPDPELFREANLKLIQMMAYAPSGAVASANVQRSENGYSATIIISSAFRTFYSGAFGLNLAAAVNRVLSKMDDQLYNWRFGRGGGQPERQRSFGDLSNYPMAG